MRSSNALLASAGSGTILAAMFIILLGAPSVPPFFVIGWLTICAVGFLLAYAVCVVEESRKAVSCSDES